MDNLYKIAAAAAGAVMSFFTGLPPLACVLLAMMGLDYVTGLLTGMAGVSSKTEGGKLSSSAAFVGLMRKGAIIVVVLVGVLVDLAVQTSSGVQFNAVTGSICLWFIASEGVSVVENVSELGVPIPGILRKALEVLKDGSGDEEE